MGKRWGQIEKMMGTRWGQGIRWRQNEDMIGIRWGPNFMMGTRDKM